MSKVMVFEFLLAIAMMVVTSHLMAQINGYGSRDSGLALWHFMATLVLVVTVFKLGEHNKEGE